MIHRLIPDSEVPFTKSQRLIHDTLETIETKNRDIALKLQLKKEQDLAKEKEKKALQLKRG